MSDDSELEYDLEEDPEAHEIDPAFYAAGGVIFTDAELDLIGDVDGMKVLNLQPGTGEEAVSLANLGAIVTVLDDELSLAEARTLASEASIDLTFADEDLNALSMTYRDGSYDLVYSGWGGIDWLTDIDSWAYGIADALKAGGRLVIYDEHPVSYMFDVVNGTLAVSNSYFGADAGPDIMSYPGEEYSEEDVIEEEFAIDEEEVEVAPNQDADGDGLDDEMEAIEEEYSWTLGDVISALGRHGVATMFMQEFQTSDRFETPLDRFYDELDEEEIGKAPSAFLLMAVKLPVAVEAD